METVWITGGSSGIGEACAYRWAEDGARLVITAPTAEELEPVAAKCREKGASDVAILPYDLSHPEGIPDLVKAAWEAFGGLSTVYLNAGISQRTSVEDTSMEMLRTLMEIDYFAPAGIAKELLPRMVAQGGGHIAVTTSIAGRFGFRLRCAVSGRTSPSAPWTRAGSPMERWIPARPAASPSKKPPGSSSRPSAKGAVKCSWAARSC